MPVQDQNSTVVPIDSDHGTSISFLQHPATNNSLVHPHINSSALHLANHLTDDLKYFTLHWPLTTTLSLKLNIGPWQLPPARILACLAAANRTVEKKVGTQVLERRFTQREGSRINTLLFEIGPEIGEDRRLTWADVAVVLGEGGLVKFFLGERYWTSTYFDVMHVRWGKVGEGAVRKWYQ